MSFMVYEWRENSGGLVVELEEMRTTYSELVWSSRKHFDIWAQHGSFKRWFDRHQTRESRIISLYIDPRCWTDT
jgi:hypothetical protein